MGTRNAQDRTAGPQDAAPLASRTPRESARGVALREVEPSTSSLVASVLGFSGASYVIRTEIREGARRAGPVGYHSVRRDTRIPPRCTGVSHQFANDGVPHLPYSTGAQPASLHGSAAESRRIVRGLAQFQLGRAASARVSSLRGVLRAASQKRTGRTLQAHIREARSRAVRAAPLWSMRRLRRADSARVMSESRCWSCICSSQIPNEPFGSLRCEDFHRCWRVGVGCPGRTSAHLRIPRLRLWDRLSDSRRYPQRSLGVLRRAGY